VTEEAPQAPLIEQSAQASDLLLHFENNQPSKWEGTAQGYYSRVTDVSTGITPYWSWSLSTLPAPLEASGYMRVKSKRGVFSPFTRMNGKKLGDCQTRFEAALIADVAKCRQIVEESEDGRLKRNKDFWKRRQLNSNPNKEHDLAKVSDDRVLTTGASSIKGIAVAPLPGSAGHFAPKCGTTCRHPPLGVLHHHARFPTAPLGVHI
jgi:hypothetical protein